MTNETSSPSFTCVSCEAGFDWLPLVHHGLPFCCAGCAAGGPCSCSYDRLGPSTDPLEVPMTEAAWRSLSLEASRLEHDLDEALARRRQELGTPGHEDPALPLWRIERAQENLETLQAVLGGARVVPADGRAVVGARVTLRVDGGTPESYAIVAPGEGDATRNRVPADSSLGEHLLGRRASARFVLKTPAGRRGYEVVAVEYPEEAWAPGRSSLPMGEAESPLVSAISRDLALVR